tara:strand:- start:1051 stop:2457 length:1407 start_codon:yes stop_codon:yes gene_type:complete
VSKGVVTESFDGWAVPPGTLTDLVFAEDGGVRHPVLDTEAARGLLVALRAAREDALLRDTVQERVRLLGRAGARFLDPEDPLRQEAEERLPATADISPEMARAVIEGMARDWTAERLAALLSAELSQPEALDRFVPQSGGGRARAFAPALSFHIGAGTVPGVSATSMLRGLLLGSATLVKPGVGDVVLPVLLARALAEEAPRLASAVAVLYWSGGSGEDTEQVLLETADLVVAYGGDATVRSLRDRLPVTTPLVAYHHRLSVALVGRSALSQESLPGVASTLARAVALFDQRGCVSPHAVLVEQGGDVGARELTEALARELERLHRVLPPTDLAPSHASAVHQLRRTCELRRGAGENLELHTGPGASWTVVLESANKLEPSCLGRTVRVHSVVDALEVPDLLVPVGRHLQTVGVAGLGDRVEEVAAALGKVGAVRICPLGDVPFPPPWWHHDGRGPLSVFLRWVDLED